MRPVGCGGVLLAGGAGSRVGAGINKVLLPLAGVPLIVHSIRAMLEVEQIHRVVLVVRPEDREVLSAAVAPHLGSHDLWLVDGGSTRHDSEWHALLALSSDIEAGEIDVVAIHDGARPLAPAGLWQEVIETARRHGGALPVASLPGVTGRDGATDAASLRAVQTPQAFRARELLAAYQRAHTDGFTGTDTAACLERYSELPVVGVPFPATNLKVTFPEDVALAQQLLDQATISSRARTRRG